MGEATLLSEADLIARMAWLAGAASDTDAMLTAADVQVHVGDAVVIEMRGKHHRGVIAEVGTDGITVGVITRNALDTARRNTHYHQHVKLPGYPEYERARGGEDAYRKALLAQEIAAKHPWAAWANVTTKTVARAAVRVER